MNVRRYVRYSMVTLLAVVSIFASLLAVWRNALDRSKRDWEGEQVAIRDLEGSGAFLKQERLNPIWATYTVSSSRGYLFDRVVEVDASHSTLDLPALRKIAKFRGLRQLNVASCPVDDSWLAELPQLRQLEVLNLQSTEISGKDLSALEDLPLLHSVNLSRIPFGGPSWDSLLELRAIDDVTMDACELPDDWLQKFVATQRQLRSLSVAQNAITDRAIEEVGSLKGLTVLRVEHTLIGNRGMKCIAACTDLEVLDVSGTAMSDAAVDDLLRLKKLRNLGTSHSGISASGRARLVKEFGDSVVW